MTHHVLDIRGLTHLWHADPTHSGALPKSANFIDWLCHAVCLGLIDEVEDHGYGLTPSQEAYWQKKMSGPVA